MINFEIFMLFFLVICVIGVLLMKSLFHSIIIYTAFSMAISIIWVVLQSPDVAITEAAAGTGITTILFFVTLRNINRLEEAGDAEIEEDD